MELKNSGDPIEQKYFKFILAQLPAYQLIWEKYIGNDGNSKPIIDTPEIWQTAQHLYTCLLSILSMDDLKNRIIEIDPVDKENHCIPQNLLKLDNTVVNFFAHIGRIRDNVGKAGAVWGEVGLGDKYEELWKKRNTILHGPKAPYRVSGGEVEIVTLNKSWDDKKIWNESFSYVPLYDLLEDSISKIYQEFNASIYCLVNKIEEGRKSGNVDFIPTDQDDNYGKPKPSGTA